MSLLFHQWAKWDKTVLQSVEETCWKPKKSSRKSENVHLESKKLQMPHLKVCLMKLFCFRFFDKTKNEWEERGTFEKVAGKYDMVFMDYSTNEKVRLQDKEATTYTSLQHFLITLNSQTQKLQFVPVTGGEPDHSGYCT